MEKQNIVYGALGGALGAAVMYAVFRGGLSEEQPEEEDRGKEKNQGGSRVTRMVSHAEFGGLEKDMVKKTYSFDGLKAWSRAWVNGGQLPHAGMAILWKNKVIFRDTIGLADVDAGTPFNTKSISRIFSMTKPIVSLAAMILVDRGSIALDDELGKHLPEFHNRKLRVYVSGGEKLPDGTTSPMVTEPAHRPITIRDLMRHTSGFTYGIFSEHPVDVLTQAAVPNLFESTTRKLTAALAEVPLLFQPGTKYQYSFSTDVLGYVIEMVSGQPLDEFLKREILEPLGMVDTDFFIPPEKLKRSSRVCEKVEAGMSFRVQQSLWSESGRGSKPPMLSGGGGLFSTMEDYLCFMQLLINEGEAPNGKRLLSKESFRLLTQENHLPEGKDMAQCSFLEDCQADASYMGQGWSLFGQVLRNPEEAQGGRHMNAGMYGWSGLASTCFSIDPVRKCGFLFFSQLVPSYTSPTRVQFLYLASAVAKRLDYLDAQYS